MTPVLRTCLVVLLLALPLMWRGAAHATPPGDVELKPTAEWSGSVADDALQNNAPAQGFITDGKTFAKLWQAWKVGDKLPTVDFKKEVVLVETTKGSRLNVGVRLTPGGDLKVLGAATRDYLPGFRYQIVVVPREGVKTINGKALPRD